MSEYESVQGTMKVLMSLDFTSDLTPFLIIIGKGDQPSIGGGGGHPKRYKVTPLDNRDTICN